MTAEELRDDLLNDIQPCPYFGWWDLRTEEEAYAELKDRLNAIIELAREEARHQ